MKNLDSSTQPKEKIGYYRWLICALILFATTVNYVDRAVLGVLAPTLRTQIYNEDVYAVDHVSLKVEEGKSLGIAGESGCGKSTLALSLMGYYFAPLHYTSGEIIIDGRKISGMDPDDVRKSILGTEIAYIPQSAMNALNPTRKTINFVEDVLQAHDMFDNKKKVYERASGLFETLGLPASVLQKFPVELSGGMKQRTVIAVSVILLPKVLIADEPSSALDVTSQKMVIKMLKQLLETGLIGSLIFITHELPLLYNVTDDIMVMYAGQIVEKATAKQAVFDPLHPYAKGLMGSIIVPESGLRDVKLTSIPGVPPNLKNPPYGWRFAERCKFVQPECKASSVDLRNIEGGHQAMEGLVIFHLWLAGAAMYVALRLWPPLSSPPFHEGDREAVKPLPALLGAVAFMFIDVLITHIGNLNLIAVAAWLPLILAFYARGLSERRVGWIIGSGIVFAIALLAGHAQMTAITLVGLTAVAVWQIIVAAGWRERGKVAGLALLAPLIAFGLTALQLLPSLEMTRYSLRAGLSYEEATAYSLPPAARAATFSPLLFGRGAVEFWGPWERVETMYVGVVPLILAGLLFSWAKSIGAGLLMSPS